MSKNILLVSEQNALLFASWISQRGGLLVWSSADLSNPQWSCITPAHLANGDETPSPHWKAAPGPRKIEDASEVAVITPKEVKRFRVAVRPGKQGLALKVSDGGTRRIKAAVAKAGEGAWYEFDRWSQEAVILAPESETPLPEWLESKQKSS